MCFAHHLTSKSMKNQRPAITPTVWVTNTPEQTLKQPKIKTHMVSSIVLTVYFFPMVDVKTQSTPLIIMLDVSCAVHKSAPIYYPAPYHGWLILVFTKFYNPIIVFVPLELFIRLIDFQNMAFYYSFKK